MTKINFVELAQNASPEELFDVLEQGTKALIARGAAAQMARANEAGEPISPQQATAESANVVAEVLESLADHTRMFGLRVALAPAPADVN
jgi:hypothetical protein